ncbi:hypothetical protein [Ammoniphilus sp. YIM 78166]|uniref:hypothetical protein n=1 Tax=Ammoniphilus sp. YIM 78166 TaxID=1644106 RepID=UPI00106F8A26|nr:hypothetical protein [Ammoniphilus sp. YIM 78166]
MGEARFYIVTTGRQSVKKNGTIILQMVNPLISNKTLYLGAVKSSGSSDYCLEVQEDCAILATGVPLQKFNSERFSYDYSSDVSAQMIIHDANPIVGGDLIDTYFSHNGIAGRDYKGRFIVMPGQSVTFCIANLTGAEQYFILNVGWMEK